MHVPPFALICMNAAPGRPSSEPAVAEIKALSCSPNLNGRVTKFSLISQARRRLLLPSMGLDLAIIAQVMLHALHGLAHSYLDTNFLAASHAACDRNLSQRATREGVDRSRRVKVSSVAVPDSLVPDVQASADSLLLFYEAKDGPAMKFNTRHLGSKYHSKTTATPANVILCFRPTASLRPTPLWENSSRGSWILAGQVEGKICRR